MSNTEDNRIPSQGQWRDDVVEYGPEVPLAYRLEREHADLISH